MALPADFWRDEQMLNIFRTKRCQRLLRDGVCEWRDHCQFAHNLDWPRRPPLKHRYMPLLCPHVRVVSVGHGDNARVRIENSCNKGVRCSRAHSKEEVLYHPQLFKTSICEEHRNSQDLCGGRGGNRGSRAARARCHRYYCPFAHGTAELRPTQLSPEQREQCLRAIEIFPADKCCSVCDPHQMSSVSHPPGGEDVSKDAQAVPNSSSGPGLSLARSSRSEENLEHRGSMTNDPAQLCQPCATGGCRNPGSTAPCMPLLPYSVMPVTTGPGHSVGGVHQQPEVLRACTQQLMIQLGSSPIGFGSHVPNNGACAQMMQLATVGTPSSAASTPTAVHMLPMSSMQPGTPFSGSTVATTATTTNPSEMQLVHLGLENDVAESQKQPPFMEQQMQQQQQQQQLQQFQHQFQPPPQPHPQAPYSNCICVVPVENGLRASMPLQAVVMTAPYWQPPTLSSQTSAANSSPSVIGVPWQQLPPCGGVVLPSNE